MKPLKRYPPTLVKKPATESAKRAERIHAFRRIVRAQAGLKAFYKHQEWRTNK